MGPLGSRLRRAGARVAGRALSKVVFVSYGGFESNSAGHIDGFARELHRQGYAVTVAARGSALEAYAQGAPPYAFASLQDLAKDPDAVIGFDGRLEPERTALVCWTPRKASRNAAQKAFRVRPMGYVVHLEDNEDHLGELRAAAAEGAVPDDREARHGFIAGAAGVTYIAPRLQEGVPAGTPSLWLEPGVDLEGLAEPMPALRRASLLRAAGAPAQARVLVYPGNAHRANLQEAAELYRAAGLLRGRGHELVLIKTGQDDPAAAPVLGPLAAESGVLELGRVPRPLLLDLMRCADLFVQPGAPGPFNDYRLPSKLPEFMAVGRPVVLPAANLGLRLKDGVEALMLHEGSAGEIAARVEQILADPGLARRLGANARAFAARTWRWEAQGRRLADFLEQLWRARG